MTQTPAVTATPLVAEVQVFLAFRAQLAQEGGNLLFGLHQEVFEVEEDGLVVGFVDESRGQALLSRPTSPTNPMHCTKIKTKSVHSPVGRFMNDFTVIFDVIWHVIIDDVLDVGEVQAFGGHVGRNQHVFLVLAECFHRSRSFFLIYKPTTFINITQNVKSKCTFATVDRHRLHPFQQQILVNGIHVLFFLGKN